MFRFYIILFALLAACSQHKDEPAELEYLTVRIEKELDNLHHQLKNHIEDYNFDKDSSSVIRLLYDIYGSNKNIRAASYVNEKGILLYSVPEMSDVSGINISHQAHVDYVLKKHKPVLGKQFRAVQGFNAVTMTEPLIVEDTLHSFYSMLLSPQYLFSDIVDDYPYLDSCDVWVMQKDGTILYDEDIEEIGKNIFKDEYYCKLPGFAHIIDTITQTPHGVISYKAGGKHTQKLAWQSVRYLTADWIIVIEYPEKDRVFKRKPQMIGLKNSQDALIELSENQLFLDFIEANDERSVEEMMKLFFDDFPGLFAIQWIDNEGYNKVGFPLHNLNYLGHKLWTKCKSPNILQALKDKNISRFEEYISNDYQASFYSVPLYNNSKYLGMVYFAELNIK